jgi:hypothetical protein
MCELLDVFLQSWLVWSRRSIAESRPKRRVTHGIMFVETDSAFHLDGKVMPAVKAYISDLVDRSADLQVQELVRLGLKMLNPNPHKRIKMSTAASSLALLVCYSYSSVVDKYFRGLLYRNEGRKSNFHVLVLLEQKRFEAWKAAYSRSHPNQKLENMDIILANLKHLLIVL